MLLKLELLNEDTQVFRTDGDIEVDDKHTEFVTFDMGGRRITGISTRMREQYPRLVAF